MGKSSPSPPPAPDPVKTASAQGAANVATATAQTALNNANVVTPYGSTTYAQTGQQTITQPDGTVSTLPTYTQTQTLSDAQQKLLNQNNALGIMMNRDAGHALTSIGNTLSTPITSDQLSPLTMTAGTLPAMAYGYDQGGKIQTSVPIQQADTTFGQTAGAVQYDVDQQGIQQARDSATNAALARLQPSMDQQSSALQASLANQGVGLGSSAYGSAMFSQNQANNDLRLGAVQVGDAEQQALYGQALQSGQFHNAAQAQDFSQQQARGQFQQAGTAANNAANLAGGTFANAAQGQQNQENAAQAAFSNAAAVQDYQNRLSGGAFQNQAAAQQLQQLMGLQNQQINEISALRSGGQVAPMSMPGYSAGTLDQTPISADTYQSAAIQNSQYQAQLQNQAANTAAMGSALGGIGSMFGRKSDRRLKSEVSPVVRARNGLMIYRYKLAGEAPGWHMGFMADEVALIHPEAVWTDPGDGWARVDYARAVA